MTKIKPVLTSSVDVTADRLKAFIERIERLSEEKQGLADGIKDVLAESKSAGFDPKIIREVIRLRKLETGERQERETLLDTYMRALGMAVT